MAAVRNEAYLTTSNTEVYFGYTLLSAETNLSTFCPVFKLTENPL